MLPDPLTVVQRLLDRAERELIERVIEAGSSAAAAAAGAVRGHFMSKIRDFMRLLGKLPHATANWILNLDRGPSARRLTHIETQLVQEAFGARINPGDVRIVRGPGLSLWAAIAFQHGNPAITLGNTIYIKSKIENVILSDLSQTLRGIDMLLHEYTHVVQYATLGFGTFADRYISDLRAHGFDDNELYAYRKRNNDWQHETLEGQAQIVGEFGAARREMGNREKRALADRLRAKLKGTGIYAQ